MEIETKKGDTVVVGIKRNGETFLFLYRDNEVGRIQAFAAIGRAASDPKTVFNWFDAATLSQRIRRQG